MTQLVSIKDTRNKLAEIVDKVAIGQETFIITKFGKPKARIVPISDSTTKTYTSGIEKSFGAWAKRDDIKNTAEWAAKLRSKMSSRQ